MKLIDYQIKSPIYCLIKTAFLPIGYLNVALCGWLSKGKNKLKI